MCVMGIRGECGTKFLSNSQFEPDDWCILLFVPTCSIRATSCSYGCAPTTPVVPTAKVGTMVTPTLLAWFQSASIASCIVRYGNTSCALFSGKPTLSTMCLGQEMFERCLEFGEAAFVWQITNQSSDRDDLANIECIHPLSGDGLPAEMPDCINSRHFPTH